MTPLMGVAIVTYNSRDHILCCLETLLAATQSYRLRIVIVDNASPDGTAQTIRDWAHGRTEANWPDATPVSESRITKPLSLSQGPQERLIDLVTLIENPTNDGFAAGVNRALCVLQAEPEIDRFWILNPDCLVPRKTPSALMSVKGEFGLLGTRMLYAEDPGTIQMDFGQIDPLTGRTHNASLGHSADSPFPAIETADFICGASMLVTRAFLSQAGPMPERYFLYYEEVDWAQRRGALPLSFSQDAPVFHIAGACIGSPTLERGPSALSHFHKHRSRIVYVRSHLPGALLSAIAFGGAKAAQTLMRQGPSAAWAVLRGLMSGLAHGHETTRSRQATAVATADKSP